MLGIKGTTRLWYVSSITNMRFGNYRLFFIALSQRLGYRNWLKAGYRLFLPILEVLKKLLRIKSILHIDET